MAPSENPLEGLIPLHAAQILPNATISPRTVLTSKISMMASKASQLSSMTAGTPRLTFTMSQKFKTTQTSYTSAGKTNYQIKVIINVPKGSEDALGMAYDTVYAWFEARENVAVDVSGMRVVTWGSADEGKGLKCTLEGDGPVWTKAGDKSAVRLFAAVPPTRSIPNQHFTHTNLIAGTTKSTTALPQPSSPEAGPSRLRPVSAHMLSNIAIPKKRTLSATSSTGGNAEGRPAQIRKKEIIDLRLGSTNRTIAQSPTAGSSSEGTKAPTSNDQQAHGVIEAVGEPKDNHRNDIPDVDITVGEEGEEEDGSELQPTILKAASISAEPTAVEIQVIPPTASTIASVISPEERRKAEMRARRVREAAAILENQKQAKGDATLEDSVQVSEPSKSSVSEKDSSDRIQEVAGSSTTGQQNAQEGIISAQRLQEEEAARVEEAKQRAAQSERLSARRRAEEEAARAARAQQVARDQAAQMASRDVNNLKEGLSTNGITYIPLSQTRPETFCNVFGVVLETQGLKQSIKGDWIITLILTDPSIHKSDNSGEDFVITVFRRTQDQLPVLERGSIALFRNVKVTFYNNKCKGQLFSVDNNAWAAYLPDGKLGIEPSATLNPQIGKPGLDRLRALRRWWAGIEGNDAVEVGEMQIGGTAVAGPSRVQISRGRMSSSSVGSGSSGPSAGKKASLLGDAQPGMFFDGIFKIIHVHATERRNLWAEIYITDGTLTSYTPRNYHGVQPEHIPLNAIFTLAILNKPPVAEQPYFQAGKYLKMNNINAKMFKEQLELKWSEMVTREQEDQGWTRRRLVLIEKEDQRAKVIEQRLKDLRTNKGQLSPRKPTPHDRPHEPLQDISINQRPNPIASTSNVPDQEKQKVPISTTVSTIYTDEINHPTSSIEDILRNQTFPNKFRLFARVKSLHSRGIAGNNDSYIQKYCGHCKRAFQSTYCKSCNDESLSKADYRYRFIAILEDSNNSSSTLTVLISDSQAAAFLPPLPPLSNSENPNDKKKSIQQLRQCCTRVEEMLLGSKMNGEYIRPAIDWGLESWMTRDPNSKKGEKGREVVVWRVCGMESK